MGQVMGPVQEEVSNDGVLLLWLGDTCPTSSLIREQCRTILPSGARIIQHSQAIRGHQQEFLAEFMDRIQQNVNDVRLFIDQLTSIYDSIMIPEEGNALAIIKSVMGNGSLLRDDKLPGGLCTPDQGWKWTGSILVDRINRFIRSIL